MTTPLRRLSLPAIWNMSFGFLRHPVRLGPADGQHERHLPVSGRQRESTSPLLWLAAPLTGLIVQPIVGDLQRPHLGRARPAAAYFLVGAILASLALIAMPNSSAALDGGGLALDSRRPLNITMEPFRAFVGDLLPAEQRNSGFAMQSLLIGLGAVLSSALPYMLTTGSA